jgi:hypothetical protein
LIGKSIPNFESIFQIILNSLGNLGDEELRVTGIIFINLATCSLPILIESIKHHKASEKYNPIELFYRKIADSLKAILFTLTLEVKPRMVFLKLDNLAKIIHLASPDLNVLPQTLIVNSYKLILKTMSKAKLKMIANDLGQRV